MTYQQPNARKTANEFLGGRLGNPIFWAETELRYRVDDDQCIQFVVRKGIASDRVHVNALGRTKEHDGPQNMTAETLDQYLKTRGL